MPTITDVFNQLVTANTNLQQIHTDLQIETASTDAVRTSVDQVNGTLNAGFVNLSQGIQNLLQLQNFANQVLLHLAAQDDTIICILEKVSQHTCELLNEAHIQTGLQSTMQEGVGTLVELTKSAHAEAALELERQERLRQQILECCPPEKPKPVCLYEPCKAPEAPGNPPRVDYQPFQPESPTPIL